MQYPHWLMVAGAVLVAIGFIGLAFRRNRDVEPNQEPTEMKASGKRDGSDSNAATLPFGQAPAASSALKSLAIMCTNGHTSLSTVSRLREKCSPAQNMFEGWSQGNESFFFWASNSDGFDAHCILRSGSLAYV